MKLRKSIMLFSILMIIYFNLDIYFFQISQTNIIEWILIQIGYQPFRPENYINNEIVLSFTVHQTLVIEYVTEASCTYILNSFIIISILSAFGIPNKELFIIFISIQIMNLYRVLAFIILNLNGYSVYLSHDIIGTIIISTAILLPIVIIRQNQIYQFYQFYQVYKQGVYQNG